MAWIRDRIRASSLFSIPIYRDVPNHLVEQLALKSFDELMEGKDKIVILIAENVDLEKMGLLVLNLSYRSEMTGEHQSLIEDLDVDPRFWGTPAVARLCNRAAQVTAKHHMRYMTGFVAAGNRRTLLKSLRLGFELERYHLVTACDKDGLAPMPGRQDSQKAHDVSRKSRRKMIEKRAKKKE